MPTRNVNLTDHYDEFVAEQITSGRYRNASEVMRDGLRLLEQQMLEERQKLALLKKLASAGFEQLDQGGGTKLDGREDIDDFLRRVGQRAKKRLARSRSDHSS